MKLMKMVAGILLLVAIFGPRVSAQELSLYGPLPISPAPVSPPPENMLFGIPKPHLSKPHVDKPTRANFELGGGYMYRSLLQADAKRLNMNGFSMYLDYRIFRWLSVASDLSGAYNINSTNGNTQLYTLMFGARIYPLGHRHKSLLSANSSLDRVIPVTTWKAKAASIPTVIGDGPLPGWAAAASM